MANADMKVAHIGQGTDILLKVPTPPKHLSDGAKRGYKNMGQFLAEAERLKKYYLPMLEVFAENYAQWEWACKAIKDKNAVKMGTGYLQTFKNGTQQISNEIISRNMAAEAMIKCSKIFGLDPKSEKELKAVVDTGQTSLWDDFMSKKTN